MNLSISDDLRVVLRILRPHALLAGALLFGLGAAIADYLGRPIRPSTYLAGQACVSALQLASQGLLLFFAAPGERMRPGRRITLEPDGDPTSIPLNLALFIGLSGLTVCATLASALLLNATLAPISALVLLGGAVGAIFFSIPPLRMADSGYGELAASLLLAAGIPTFSYTLVTGELHRLLLMSTVPLATILFAVLLALDLENYSLMEGKSPRTLMARVGWRVGMRIHDVTLLVAYLLVAAGIGAGLPRRVGWGLLLTLPLAIAQAWYLSRIRAGTPPRWNLLKTSCYSLVGLATYLTLSGYLLS